MNVGIVSLMAVTVCILFTGCALFKQDEVDEQPVILVENVAEEEAAITQLFKNYATAMSSKNVDLFKSCFSEDHTHNYRSEIRSFLTISRQCDMQMTLQKVKLYHLSDKSATAEVVLDTHYTYVTESKKLKDFRLTTRFKLLKVKGQWIIEKNLTKYVKKDEIPEAPVIEQQEM